MTDADDAARELMRAALADPQLAQARADAALALGEAMREAGKHLWVSGYIIGPDRVAGASPFGFGSDVTVGIATGLQIGGELMSGAAFLLGQGNRYAAWALIRQLVEVEYLGWAFAEDADRTGAAWLRSTPDERRKLWQPRHLRDSSHGRFRATDYGRHCELGGHPTPEAVRLAAGPHTHDPRAICVGRIVCTRSQRVGLLLHGGC